MMFKGISFEKWLEIHVITAPSPLGSTSEFSSPVSEPTSAIPVSVSPLPGMVYEMQTEVNR
mgnify:FL=1